MNDREKLWYLINEYTKGNYNSRTFANEFSRIYDLEVDYDMIPDLENKWFYELSEMTGRFSDNKEELLIPNVYCSEEEIRKFISLMLKEINTK